MDAAVLGAPGSSTITSTSSAVPAGFPVAVRSANVPVGGQATDIVVSTYLDAVVVIVSQLGTVGTIVQARRDSSFEGKATFTTSVLLGRRDEPLLAVAARQMVELAASKGVTKPLLCCLALKQHSPEAVRELMAALAQHELL